MNILLFTVFFLTGFINCFSQNESKSDLMKINSPSASFSASNISISHRKKPTVSFVYTKTSNEIILNLGNVSIFLHRSGSTLNDQIILNLPDTSVTLKNRVEIKDSLFYYSFVTTVTKKLLEKIAASPDIDIMVVIPPSPSYKEAIEQNNYFSDNPRLKKEVIKDTEKTANIKLKKVNKTQWNILSGWLRKNLL